MRDLNDILPKIPNMKWSCLTNQYPTNAKIKEMNRMLPHDGRWHSVIEYREAVDVDGVTIRRKSAGAMT